MLRVSLRRKEGTFSVWVGITSFTPAFAALALPMLESGKTLKSRPDTYLMDSKRVRNIEKSNPRKNGVVNAVFSWLLMGEQMVDYDNRP
jgi:hypothetical protein